MSIVIDVTYNARLHTKRTRSHDKICTLGAPLWRAALATLTSEVENRARFKHR